jgi:phage-related protein
LSVARLDRSAAGRAKVRELEDELASAEEELNDFTLEHAIEQITSQMDREADEYNRFIDSKIAEIDSAIEDVETEIENVRTAIENVSRNIRAGAGDITAQINALLREYGITPPSPSPEVYHSGGFVGGVATLKSNEEFAKLMVGEHVSTPAQIQRFMNETLPGIASNSSRNEFNAPLISIECESVTTEALPGLKQIVNEAVREVKKQLDDGFSRTGYKKPVMRPI